MKRHDKVKVLTSNVFQDQIGTVQEVTNQGRVVVKFDDGQTGFYTVGKDIFEVQDN